VWSSKGAARFPLLPSPIPPGRALNSKPAIQGTDEVKPGPSRSIDEREPFLSIKAKKSLSNIRKMPETTASAREAKLQTIEKEIAAWGDNPDRLEAAVMLETLHGMHAQHQPESARPRIDADVLPQGITPEMFDKMYKPPEPILPEPTAPEPMKNPEWVRAKAFFDRRGEREKCPTPEKTPTWLFHGLGPCRKRT